MWESPIYKVKAKIGNRQKEILIDVTGSAPNFSVPGSQLVGTFKILLEGLEPKKTKILDFGAAKLRNTIYLLKRGYTVYSCEFDDLFKRSQQAAEFLKKAKSFKNFKTLVYPQDFIDNNEKFDVILLINVLNIMPVPIERLCVLALCKEKLKQNGRLLWYTQHGAYSESTSAGTLNDGLVTGKGRQFHMFYRDFDRKEIHEMLHSTGFSFNKELHFPTSGSNQAYVFNPSGNLLIDKTLGLTELLHNSAATRLKTVERVARWKSEEEDESKKISYTSQVPSKTFQLQKIEILEAYIKELEQIPANRQNASKYHQLIFNILTRAFDYALKDPKMEEVIAQGRQRVDITFKNYRENGFFKELDEGYHITCPNIFFECKNYSHDVRNPEFGQISLRLNNVRGQFGVIVCRKIENKVAAWQRQNDLTKDKKYVMILEDSDIKKIAKFKLDTKEKLIDKYIDDKFKDLT